MDVFRLFAANDYERRGGKSKINHESLFSAPDPPDFRHAFGLVDFAIGFTVLSILTLAYGIRPTLAALWLPLLLLLAVLTA